MIALQEAYLGEIDTVPPDCMLAADIAKIWKMTPSRTSTLLSRLVDQGIVKRKMFRVLRGASVRPWPHYKIDSTKLPKGLSPKTRRMIQLNRAMSISHQKLNRDS